MLSRQKSKLITSLRNKKERDEENLYVVEGDKIVKEYLAAGQRLRYLCATESFLKSLPEASLRHATEVIEVSAEELGKISTLKTPHNALAVAAIAVEEPDDAGLGSSLHLALDGIQDPGNMGTIIRAAAWFGIKNIACSPDCADIYNPKTVQATMGALIHTKARKTDLYQFLGRARNSGLHIYGALLDGKPVYDQVLTKNGVIIVGNESRGISENLIRFVTDRILIPPAGRLNPGIDSLNAGMAASILLYEFSRRK